MVKILAPESHWVCPNCDTTAVLKTTEPHTIHHPCPGLGGLQSPMVLDGTRCKIEAVELQDYEGDQILHKDESGRPFSFIYTTRDDGIDCSVLAPVATCSMDDVKDVANGLRKQQQGL